jgi:prepilin-type processing-associated H-X9-DG protein
MSEISNFDMPDNGSGTPQFAQRAAWVWGYNAPIPTSGVLPNVYSAKTVDDESKINGLNNIMENHSFGSNHSGGVNVAFADGAVNFANEGIDHNVFKILCGIKDGLQGTLNEIN